MSGWTRKESNQLQNESVMGTIHQEETDEDFCYCRIEEISQSSPQKRGIKLGEKLAKITRVLEINQRQIN